MAENNPTDDATFHPQHVPVVQAKPAHQALFPYFLVMLGTLLIVGLGGVWWMNSDMRAEMGRKEAAAIKEQLSTEIGVQNEREKIAANRASHARRVDRAEALLSKLAELDAAQELWTTRRQALLESDEGRDIAASSDLVARFLSLEKAYAIEPQNTERTRDRTQQIATKSRASVTSQGVVAAPVPESFAIIETDLTAASRALDPQVAANAALEALVRDARNDGVPPADIALSQAIQQGNDARELEKLAAFVDAYEAGQEGKDDEIRDIAQKAGRDQAASEIATEKKIQAQVLADLQATQDQKLRAAREEGERRIELLQKQLDERLAVLEGDIKVTEASTEAKKTDADLEAERIALEAEKEKLRQKARAPEVRVTLGALLEPGLWQPGRKLDASQPPGPISFSALQGYGALERSTSGLKRLASVFISKDDKSRSRLGKWMPGGKVLWVSGVQNGRPDAVQKFTAVQDILVELGPILVDLGMLAP